MVDGKRRNTQKYASHQHIKKHYIRRKKRITQKYASHSSWWTDRPFDFVSWAITVPHRQSHEGTERCVCDFMGIHGFGGGLPYKRSKDNKGCG